MATTSDLVSLGLSSLRAMHLGWTADTGITALANNTRTDAYEITETINQITTSTATDNSVVLPAMEGHPTKWFFIRNGSSGPGATALNVFPVDTSERFNELSLGAGISIAVGSSGIFLSASATEWLVSVF